MRVEVIFTASILIPCCATVSPPSSAALYVGKHVGEDPNVSRADETIGYMVVESGSGTISGVAYEAGVGADIVEGVGNAPPRSLHDR